METTSIKTVAHSKPHSRTQSRVNRFFKHAITSIPPHAQIISAKGISKKGTRSATYTYKVDGRVSTVSFFMGGQQS